MNILFAASEVTPMIKSGGLADVIGALPASLNKSGHDARIVVPAYPSIDMAAYGSQLIAEMNFAVGQVEIKGRVYEGRLGDTIVYLADFEPGLEADDLYPHEDQGDQQRFVIFGLVVLEWLKDSLWQPNIIHGHDWMTGSLLAEIRERRLPYGTVLTIHNAKYQGKVDEKWLTDLELEYATDDKGQVNQLRLGLVAADRLTTVSRTYAAEIQRTGSGYGLESVYGQRSADLTGIVNGIDQKRFGPLHNPYVQPSYSSRMAVKAKQQHKHALQARLGLPAKHDLPVYGMIGRATEDKGFSLLSEVVQSSPFLEQAQLVIVASPDEAGVEKDLRQLAKKQTKNLRVILDFDEALAHQVYAASDFLVVPSRREPCGLIQMIAMRYGTVPIVHKTGGLADTVLDIRNGDEGTGIVFSDYAAQGLSNALGRSMGLYNDKHRMPALIRHIMNQDWSWDKPVMEYEAVYKSLVKVGGRDAGE